MKDTINNLHTNSIVEDHFYDNLLSNCDFNEDGMIDYQEFISDGI